MRAPDFTNPNGTQDRRLNEHEAQLWLLSEYQRKHGYRVKYDADAGRWKAIVDGSPERAATCVTCGNTFDARRSTARYCSEKCKKRAQRRNVPLNRVA